jgi:hypothetical protein
MTCTVHPKVTLTVHPRRWGWICRACRAAGQSTPQPYPFVPLPPVRSTQPVAPELDIRPVPRSAPVPSSSPEPHPLSRRHRAVGAGQLALAQVANARSIPRTEEARGSNPLTSTPQTPWSPAWWVAPAGSASLQSRCPGSKRAAATPNDTANRLPDGKASPGFAAPCSASIQSSQTFCLMMARGRASGVDRSPNGLAPVSALARITDRCPRPLATIGRP